MYVYHLHLSVNEFFISFHQSMSNKERGKNMDEK